MCWNPQFCATWHDSFIKKSQSGSISGSVWLRISDVSYADHCLKHYLKSHMIRSSLRSQSGLKIAPVSQILPIQALYRLRSGYSKALSDNKLLDYLAEQGFGRTSDKIESGCDSGRSWKYLFLLIISRRNRSGFDGRQYILQTF